MEQANIVIIKVEFSNKLRRMIVGISNHKLDYDFQELKKRVTRVLNLPADADLSLTYTDIFDVDGIALVDDEDLWDAVSVQRLNPFRIKARLNSSDIEGTTKVDSSDQSKFIGTTANKVNPPGGDKENSDSLTIEEWVSPKVAESSKQGGDKQNSDSVTNNDDRLLTEVVEDSSKKCEKPQIVSTFFNARKTMTAHETSLAAPASIAATDLDSDPHVPDTCNRTEIGKGSNPFEGFNLFNPYSRSRNPGSKPVPYHHDLFDKSANFKEQLSGSQTSRNNSLFPNQVVPAVGLCKPSTFNTLHQGPKNTLNTSNQGLNTWNTLNHCPVNTSNAFSPFVLSGDGPDWRPTRSRNHSFLSNSEVSAAGLCKPRTLNMLNQGLNTWNTTLNEWPKLDCRNLSDVNISDIAPSTPFTKIWRIRNTGNITWLEGMKLAWFDGDSFNDKKFVMVKGIPAYGVPSGSEIDIFVDLISPEKTGYHISFWKMATATGMMFGQPLVLQIKVVDDSSNYTTPTNSVDGINLNLSPAGSQSKEPVEERRTRSSDQANECNNLQQPLSVENICGGLEWDPILEELKEMGYNDTEHNTHSCWGRTMGQSRTSSQM